MQTKNIIHLAIVFFIMLGFTGCVANNQSKFVHVKTISMDNIQHKEQKQQFFVLMQNKINNTEDSIFFDSKEKEDELFIYKQLMKQSL